LFVLSQQLQDTVYRGGVRESTWYVDTIWSVVLALDDSRFLQEPHGVTSQKTPFLIDDEFGAVDRMTRETKVLRENLQCGFVHHKTHLT
jgi:hypothetical protein